MNLKVVDRVGHGPQDEEIAPNLEIKADRMLLPAVMDARIGWRSGSFVAHTLLLFTTGRRMRK
jgi:hypothetical protein